MTTSTIFSTIPFAQNNAGVPVPSNTIVNAGGLVERFSFSLSVTPVTGWAEAAVSWGPDGVNYPGQISIFESPTGTGTQTEAHRAHGALLEPGAGGDKDGAQYFKGELMSISPNTTATLTVTY